MKILKLLNKKNLIILFGFFLIQNANTNEPVDIWNIEKTTTENKINEVEQIENINNSLIKIEPSGINNLIIDEEKEISSNKLDIVGIYDPSENNLSIDMWSNSNGKKIFEILKRIEKINLSKDAADILNITLFTNSYNPKNNITNEEFLNIKSNWLIKQENLKLIETYLEKNKNLKNQSKLVNYYLDYYLSKSDLETACNIFQKTNSLIVDDYVSKFNVYCLINLEKKEEAQLKFDLLQETGFEDIFFEKKFAYLMGYDENLDDTTSEKSLLNFHLSHRTNIDFKFEPKIETSNLIWKYLSSSNLLESVDFIDLEDKEKIITIEKAVHEKHYKESDLFSIYERFLFNIKQLLTAKESHKLLVNHEARALIYQKILLTTNDSKKIELIKTLKELFEKDNISNAFDNKLLEFLNNIDESEVPSNYTNFYKNNLVKTDTNKQNIKYNNKIIHQSKILSYFGNKSNQNNIEKDLENLLKKIKKDKKYFFSIKDAMVLDSLVSDGVKIPKKYQNIYQKIDPNIPYDIQILINKEETGLALLRLVEIIGQDRIKDIDPETLHFIVSVLNQLDLDKFRNQILLKVLPLKV
tara:strand:+ start:209 stop:1957 length:1749 start_codon:yes stop_codon:yes gene_type:complete